jgi:hypothetical protein
MDANWDWQTWKGLELRPLVLRVSGWHPRSSVFEHVQLLYERRNVGHNTGRAFIFSLKKNKEKEK